MSEQFILEKGVIRSVSIILYDKELGFLLCDEMRKDFVGNKSLNSHMIGGKVDMEDSSPLFTGIREFSEELEYRYQGLSIDETINKLMNEFNECKKLWYDHLVSPKKGFYNRFYIINISKISDKEFKNELILFLTTWSKKETSVLESVYFWKKGEKFNNEETSLLNSFIKILPSKQILE